MYFKKKKTKYDKEGRSIDKFAYFNLSLFDEHLRHKKETESFGIFRILLLARQISENIEKSN